MEIDIDEAYRISLTSAETFATDAVGKLMTNAGTYRRSGAFCLNDGRQFVTPGSTHYPPLDSEPPRRPDRKNIIFKGWALRTAVRLKGVGERTDRRHFFISDTCDVLLMWDRHYATHISTASYETARLLVNDLTMATLAREIMDIAKE